MPGRERGHHSRQHNEKHEHTRAQSSIRSLLSSTHQDATSLLVRRVNATHNDYLQERKTPGNGHASPTLLPITNTNTQPSRNIDTHSRQAPSIALTPRMPRARVLQQTQTLQPRQQLRNLPLIRDPRKLRDHTITHTRMLPHVSNTRACDTSGASAHQPTDPAPPSPRPRRSPEARPAHRQGRQGTILLAPRRRRTLIRQHDHSHQFRPTGSSVAHAHSAPTAHTQSRTSPRQDPPRSAAGTHARCPPHGPRPTRPPSRQNLLAPRQHPRTTMQRLRHTHPRERRLTIQKTQNPPQPTTHTLTPRQPTQIRSNQLALNLPHDIIQDRQQTIVAIIEQVIERPPRNPRTRSDMRNRHARRPNSSTVTTAADSSRDRCISDTCTRAREEPRRGRASTLTDADITRSFRVMRVTKRAGRMRDGVFQLRLQARGRSTRSGLAGRTLT